MTRCSLAALVCAAMTLSLSAVAIAAPGSRDTSYGVDGIVTGDPLPYSNVVMTHAAAAPGGRVAVIGGADEGAFVARYGLADARLDPSFGGGGHTMPYPNTPEVQFAYRDVLPLPDGRVALAGFVNYPAEGVPPDYPFPVQSRDALVVMLKPDGSPDPSWSGDGMFRYVNPDVAADDLGRSADGYKLALDAQGRLVLGGTRGFKETSGNTTSTWARVIAIRFTPSGEPDPAFGDGGVAVTRAQDAYFNDMVIAPDGGILLSSTRQNFSEAKPGESYVARVTGAGVVDGGYGTGGYGAVPGESFFPRLVAQAGGVVTVGQEQGSYPQPGFGPVVMSRLTTTGVPDGSFGAGGTTRLIEGLLQGVLPRGDGSFLVVRAPSGGTDRGWFNQISANGVFDTTFEGDGYPNTEFFPFGGFLVAGNKVMFWRQVSAQTGAADSRLRLTRHCLHDGCGPEDPTDPDDPGDPGDVGDYDGPLRTKSRVMANKKLVFSSPSRCVAPGADFPLELDMKRGPKNAREGTERLRKILRVDFIAETARQRDKRKPFAKELSSDNLDAATSVTARIVAKIFDTETEKTSREKKSIKRRLALCV